MSKHTQDLHETIDDLVAALENAAQRMSDVVDAIPKGQGDWRRATLRSATKAARAAIAKVEG